MLNEKVTVLICFQHETTYFYCSVLNKKYFCS